MRLTSLDHGRKIIRLIFFFCLRHFRPCRLPFGLVSVDRERKENYFASIFGQSWQSRLSCLSSCLDLSFSGNIQQWHLKLNTNCLSRFISQLWVEQLAMIHCQSTILTWSWCWLGGEEGELCLQNWKTFLINWMISSFNKIRPPVLKQNI